MLIGRAPVRISFGGGGTDLEAYYSRYGGFVINATINKYIYGIVTKNFDTTLQFISADYQSLFNLPHGTPAQIESELELSRTMLRYFNLEVPANIFVASEVPPGTGLGSSGTVAVNLANILSTLKGKPLSSHELAETAYHIEVKMLGAPVGKQDQYAAAFGGLNCFVFDTNGVHVEPLELPASTIRQLEHRLMLFFTGNSRQAWSILQQQKEATSGSRPVVVEALHHIKELAHRMRACLEAGDLDQFGLLLDESWQHKKQLAARISNDAIDSAYTIARTNGAIGGKIAGAGGGGFLMLYCPEDRQAAVSQALAATGLRQMRFAFEFEGARILLHTSTLRPSPAWNEQ